MPDFEKASHRLSLADLRESYGLAELTEQNCLANPILQFERWLLDARPLESKEPNAMTLSTAST